MIIRYQPLEGGKGRRGGGGWCDSVTGIDYKVIGKCRTYLSFAAVRRSDTVRVAGGTFPIAI